MPIPVSFEQPFELILASLDGEEAVCGTAEIVEHAGDATWVRFLSASPDSATETARCVLVDTEVMSPASLAVKPDAFEVVTAVSDEPARVNSLPLPPPPDPLFDVSDASRVQRLPTPPADSPSTIAEAAASACDSEAARSEAETTMVESRRDVDIAALAALEGRFDAIADAAPPAERVTAPVEVAAIGEPPAMPDKPIVANVDAGSATREDDLRVPYTCESYALHADGSSTAREDDLRVPHTSESSPLVVDAAASDAAMRTELTMPALEAPVPQPLATDRPTVESRPLVVDAAAVAAGPPPAIVDDAVSAAIIVDSNPPDDQRPTIESPPIVASLVEITSGDDSVAVKRGIRAITNPSAKAGAPSSSTKRIVIAAASVAAASMLIAAGSVMWAQDAVARADRPSATPVATPEPVAAPTPVVAPAPVAQVVEQQPVVAQPPAQPTNCTLDIFATVPNSSVYVDGAANGSTPATATVACGKPVDVEIRHARYETFKKTVTPTGREELRATLEREKTALTVWSEPAGATVTYNGAPIGKTPLTVKIPRYEQGTLNFSMTGMQADWRRIVPKTRHKTVTIALRKR